MSESGVRAADDLSGQLHTLLRTLTPDEWAAQSGCTGWRVQDVAVHITASVHALVEPHPPGTVTADRAEQAQEQVVRSRRGWAPDRIIRELETFRRAAISRLGALQDTPGGGEKMTMFELGTYPRRHLADAFAFDILCHLHVDLLGPDGPLDRPDLVIPEGALDAAVNWMLTGLPQMCPAAVAATNAPIGLVLADTTTGAWTFGAADTDEFVSRGLHDPVAVVSCTALDFVRWGTKRAGWPALVTVEGPRHVVATTLDAIDIV